MTIISEYLKALFEYDYMKEHGHDRCKINLVCWYFHNYEHGYKHCKGSEKFPYSIKHYTYNGELIHIINAREARGHGFKTNPQWFKFNIEIKEGWYHLEKGIKKLKYYLMNNKGEYNARST